MDCPDATDEKVVIYFPQKSYLNVIRKLCDEKIIGRRTSGISSKEFKLQDKTGRTIYLANETLKKIYFRFLSSNRTALPPPPPPPPSLLRTLRWAIPLLPLPPPPAPGQSSSASPDPTASTAPGCATETPTAPMGATRRRSSAGRRCSAGRTSSGG